MYPYRYFIAAGGLVSYGPDTIDQYSRAAGYVSRILKGEEPADLPVQAHQVRACYQPQNGEGARSHCSGDAPRPRRRGDRIATLFAAVRMSLVGTHPVKAALRIWSEGEVIGLILGIVL